ncbi:hypothetical protein [Arenivirga flava]|uniref:hypothetical protein n=1 Tax=Arenivirga flava TaxID=1930060 RepID=UPI0024E1540D|nr:hypothetical protein [Arenivirga flava]
MHGHEDSTAGRFVSIADAAELLGLSVAETLGIVRSGELSAIRAGRGRSGASGSRRSTPTSSASWRRDAG